MSDEDRLRRALLDIVHINTQIGGINTQIGGKRVSCDALLQAIVRIDQVTVGVRDILFVEKTTEVKEND